ncbi:hypothetical protein HZS55_08255 [Halosimplex rubrum]|uniref:Uncharacterized protein n=1 Tax=Halosimplex rubrum TaxID=869889 RepID=A0A7D5P3I7_9EURY|nr:hypothetical protein [Halosimplex rubrum]QLH77284.1 hypothetical protein HZS55_08255 [Halosimplex rubrum]
MKIITHTCSDCGTVVSANELEDRRVTKCPGLDCEAVLRFSDLPERDREHFLDNRERYRL